MKCTDLTYLINTMGARQVDRLLALLAEVELTVSRPPRSGLVMLTVTDSFETDFHLGEVLVTEARILFRGMEGFGMVLGEAPERALARASADAVFRCPEQTEIREKLQDFLLQEKSVQKDKLMEEAALIAATKVNFDLMPGA